MAVDAEHVLVGGPSGGGKTTFLREMHARHDGASAFLTTKSNERTAQADHAHFPRVRRSSCSYPEDIHDVRTAAQNNDGVAQVCIDEVDTAPTFLDGEDGPVRGMLHDDRSQRVKCVIATQNPQDLRTTTWKYGPLQQCAYFVWVGPVKTWHSGFFDWLGVSSDQLPDENYQWVVIRPSDPPEVVAEGETNPQFG
jgi:hypothetical protein